MEHVFKEVYNSIKNNIKLNDTIVLACSGGPDSMCLLDLLLKYREKISINIVLAHVNHNVRTESDEEYLFVKKYAFDNNVIFESMKIEKYENKNFESEARDKRYIFFKKLINKYNAKYLLTAHHGDDLMETILMRMVRGSTLKGYSGFEEVSIKDGYIILRPLITVTKKDILKYNKDNKIPYVNDYTNELDIHTRNRYRKYILPKLKEEDESVNLKFLKFSKSLIEYNNYVQNNVLKIVNKVYTNNILDINKYLKQDEFIQKQIINSILSDVYKNDITYISYKHAESIYNMLKDKKSNISINLPKGKIAFKSYDKFKIINKSEQEKYNYEFKKVLMLPNGKIIKQVSMEESNSNYVCRLSSKDIKLPLFVRTKENGDTIDVMNMNGSKKIKDIFIDSKIPMNDRKEWPILVDSENNVLWIPGIKKSKYNKQINEKYDIILKYY